MSPQTYPTGSKRPWDAEAAAQVDGPDQDDDDSGGSSVDERSQNSDSQSGSGTPEMSGDVDKEMEVTKECIQNCLDGISSLADKEWAFGDRLDQAPNPGLTLKRSGIVGLPLSAQGASRVRQEANPDYGPDKGSNGLCVLGPDQFELKNPAWVRYVHSLAFKLLATHSAKSLQLQLVDLALEDPNQGFTEPQGTVPPNGDPYLKLFIYLPSSHTAGDIKCKAGGDSKSYSTASYSEFDLSYVASYSDVQWVSAPLTTGFRLQLTYFVFSRDNQPIETANSLTGYARDFENELKKWTHLRKTTHAPDVLAYATDDHYNGKVLDFASLTQADSLRANFLRDQCKNSGVRPFLSKLTGTKTVSYGTSDDDVTMELVNLIDFDGQKVLNSIIDIEPDCIVQEDIYSDREANDSGYEYKDEYKYEYRNKYKYEYEDEYESEPEEEEEEESYVDFVFVLIPEDYVLEFLVANTDEVAICAWIQRLTKTFDPGSPPEDSSRKELAYIVSEYIKRLQMPPPRYTSNFHGRRPPEDPPAYYKEGLGMLIRASILLQDSILLKKSLCKHPAQVRPEVFVDVGKALIPSNMGTFGDGLEQALAKFDRLDTCYRILCNVVAGYASAAHDDHGRKFLDNWVLIQIEKKLNTLGTCCAQDAHAMIDIGGKYGADYLINRIVPLAAGYAHNFDFIVTFLERLQSKVGSSGVSKDSARVAVQGLLPTMAPTFAEHLLRPSIKRPKLEGNFNPSRSENVPATTESHRMASVIELCLMLDLKEGSDLLIWAVAKESTHGDVWWLRNILIPFLQDVAAMVSKYSVSSLDSYQHLFQGGLHLLKNKYLGPKPPVPVDWKMPRRGCGMNTCRDCREQLDPFLQDPRREYMEFTSTGPRRNHLQERVRNELSLKTSTKQNARAPHILVFDKTRDEFKRTRGAWYGRLLEFEKVIRSMEVEGQVFHSLLGNQYTALTGRPYSKKESDESQALPQPTERQPLTETQPSAAVTPGVKKKMTVDIVDLTEE